MKKKNCVSAKQEYFQNDLNMRGLNGYVALVYALNEFDAIELKLTTDEKVYVSTEDELGNYFNFG